ncbi:MAG: hypothetical protein MUE88_09765 [Flavobacteriales bacterium]|jgi:photosystem II stability/assembly factor-like uncharacterized protein|nr:hypothetical protein [Flavobacteriales bacterium]
MRLIRTLAVLFVSAFTLTASAQAWDPYNCGFGNIKSITVHNNAIYVASYPNGIYKSTNDGVTWEAVNTGLPVEVVDGIEFIYAESVGSNGTFLFAGTSSGIYRSNNNGASWQLANGPLTANFTVYANKWLKSGSKTLAIFAGTIANGGGIYATGNNGNTWIQGANNLSTNMRVYQVAVVGNLLYAATSAGLFVSDNNADDWDPMPNAQVATYAIQGTPERLVTISDFGYRYSTNEGQDWSNPTSQPAAPNANAQLILYDGKYFAITGTGAGVVRSINNGQSWQPFNTGLVDFDATLQEEFHASGTKLYLGALFDLYSIDGTTLGVDGAGAAMSGRAFPTAFQTGFTVELPSELTEARLVLMDVSGRIVREQRVSPGSQWVSREQLASGAYRASVRDAQGTPLIDLGTLIAE